jgi:hypothetical protein
MSWFTPILLTPNERSSGACAPRAANSASAGTITVAGAQRAAERGAGLGSARVGVQWAWSTSPAQMTTTAPAMTVAATTHAVSDAQGTCLRAPVEVLRQMSAAARGLGRSESEVWVEAAREWLRKREGEPGAPPAAAAPVVASVGSIAPRRITRLWDDIDALLIELRAPAIAAAHECDGAPAA